MSLEFIFHFFCHHVVHGVSVPRVEFGFLSDDALQFSRDIGLSELIFVLQLQNVCLVFGYLLLSLKEKFQGGLLFLFTTIACVSCSIAALEQVWSVLSLSKITDKILRFAL